MGTAQITVTNPAVKNHQGTPLTKNIASPELSNSIAVPRSGCRIAKSIGTQISINGIIKFFSR